jgi:hypothetical protein
MDAHELKTGTTLATIVAYGRRVGAILILQLSQPVLLCVSADSSRHGLVHSDGHSPFARTTVERKSTLRINK